MRMKFITTELIKTNEKKDEQIVKKFRILDKADAIQKNKNDQKFEQNQNILLSLIERM